jgi:hypothetical protein
MGGALMDWQTKHFKNPYTIFIDGVNVADHAALVESYTIGGTPVKPSVYLGRNRTTPRELARTIGMRSVSFSLFFQAKTQRELALHKSELDAQLVGLPDLHMPDGFYYRCSVDSIGALEILGVEEKGVIGLASYQLQGIRHDPLTTVEGNTVHALGTMPQMDCRLTCAASQDYDALQVGPVVFAYVPGGAVVVADGIDGLLQVNGSPAVGATITRLPYLVPGDQTIPCPEPLIVEYYPTWI